MKLLAAEFANRDAWRNQSGFGEVASLHARRIDATRRKAPGTGAFLVVATETRKTADCVVVGTVLSEPVSKWISLMNRENTGNIAEFGIFEPEYRRLTHCNCTVLIANSLLNRTGK
jgi:hypothetical protein